MSETKKEELMRTEQTHTLALNPNFPGHMMLMRDDKHMICKQKPDPAIVLNALQQPTPISVFCGTHCPLFILSGWKNASGEDVRTTADVMCGTQHIRYDIHEGQAKKETPILKLG